MLNAFLFPGNIIVRLNNLTVAAFEAFQEMLSPHLAVSSLNDLTTAHALTMPWTGAQTEKLRMLRAGISNFASELG